MKRNQIAESLLNWYSKNKRELPWRLDRDPYKIWLSEIILQQTRVDQGLPYYQKFVNKYPSIHELANAHENEVLRTWQGLGYYSRARNLHNCAKVIDNEFNGVFPTTKAELLKLPGIGPYTSAAISSLAFKEKEAVVDGNVIRVITRLYGIRDDVSNQKTINQVQLIVDELIPSDQPDRFNQAIMEFGALHCTPKNPSCDDCPIIDQCIARVDNDQKNIPFKEKKIKKRTRYLHYLIIEIKEKYILSKRSKNDIWKGLFEFFLIETESESTIETLQLPESLTNQSNRWKISAESRLYKHILSHQTIMARFYHINTTKDFNFNPMEWKEYQLYSKAGIEDLPKSILIDRYLGEKII